MSKTHLNLKRHMFCCTIPFALTLVLMFTCGGESLAEQEAKASTITVGPSGDYQRINDAINAALDGDTIIVSPGTYHENVEFNNKNVTLTSTDHTDPIVVAATVIDGGSDGSVVSFGGSETPDCVIRGFTITNGQAAQGGGINAHGSEATIEYNVIKDNMAPWISTEPESGRGGGIFDSAGIIRHNTIINNVAIQRGGGLFQCNREVAYNLIGSNSSKYGGGIAAIELSDVNGTIHHNTIAANKNADHGGGLYECQARIEYNTILDNSVLGAGGGLSYCEGTIRHNTIWRNDALDSAGGGLYRCGWTHNATVENNTILGNESRTGGGMEQCNATIEGNLILENVASVSGGGIAGGTATFRNNIIAFNKATVGYGGGVYSGKGTFTNNTVFENTNGMETEGGGLFMPEFEIRNCIIWGNIMTQIRPHPQQTLVMNYTCLEGGLYPGTGNIGTDPSLVDPYDYDFRLDATSGCIDTGDSASEMDDACLPPGLGSARNDMGAYGGAYNCVLMDNAAESITLLAPGEKATTVAVDSYLIEWTDSDPDDDAVISLFYDDDARGLDGFPIAGGLSEDSQVDSRAWILEDVPEGVYNVYAIIDDGNAMPYYAYSKGTVTVEKPCSAYDVNCDGVLDALDVQFTINDALNLPVDFDCDVDGSNSVDALDVQFVVNAVLGLLP